MENVTVFVVDDRDIRFDSLEKALSESITYYKFILEKDLGFIKEYSHKGWTAREQMDKYLTRFKALKGYAIILLDLSFRESRLSGPEEARVHKWFPILKGKEGFNDAMRVGFYILGKLLENPKWLGEVCITSDQLTGEVRGEIEKCLLDQFKGKQSGEEIRIGNQHIRILARGMVDRDSAYANTRDAVDFFLRDFDDVWWYLKPPKVIGQGQHQEIQWFDTKAKAHKPSDGDGYVKHLNAVKGRFKRWNTESRVKALMAGDSHDPFQIHLNRDKQVACECLKDFFGEDMELNGLEWDDQITLPTSPAFPFLFSTRELLNDLKQDFKSNSKRVSLRRLRGEDDVIAVCLPLSGKWNLARSLWAGINETGRSGDTIEKFRMALRAEVNYAGRFPTGKEPPLANVFNGLEEVATPWITEDFIGLSWKAVVSSTPSL